MENGDSLYARIAELEREVNYLKALHSYNLGILDYSIAELEKENKKLKKENEEYEAVEQFIMGFNDNEDEAIRAHYREGKVIDGEWVNDENDEDEDEEEHIESNGKWIEHLLFVKDKIPKNTPVMQGYCQLCRNIF